MKTKKTDLIMQNKVFVWIVLGTFAILSIPLIAMQFTNEVDWDLPDFIVIGALLSGAGFIFVNIAHIVPSKYRIFIAAAVLAVVLYIWAELAVGIFTNLGS